MRVTIKQYLLATTVITQISLPKTNNNSGLSKEMIEAINYYDNNYEIICEYFLNSKSKKEILGDGNEKKCRFCEKGDPDVTFKSIAHAIPEALGNKSLEMAYECDQCNNLFGGTIEDSFGKWSKPMRTFARIRGKSGIPTLKKGSNGGWRIEYQESGLKIKDYQDNPIVTLDEENKKVTFSLKREPYIPANIAKALIKIGLSILPEEEFQPFSYLCAWLREKDAQKNILKQFPVLYTFTPGPMPNDLIVAMVLRRRDSVSGVPYTFFVLSYGNETFQVVLPCYEKDSTINGQSITFPPFPVPGNRNPEKYGQPKVRQIDFSSADVVKGEEVPLSCGFDSIIRIDPNLLEDSKK
jgi:HNH endonuclease